MIYNEYEFSLKYLEFEILMSNDELNDHDYDIFNAMIGYVNYLTIENYVKTEDFENFVYNDNYHYFHSFRINLDRDIILDLLNQTVFPCVTILRKGGIN